MGQAFPGTVEVFDASGQQAPRHIDSAMEASPVGVVSPAPGRYRITVTATPIESSGTYVLQMRRLSQSERLKATARSPATGLRGRPHRAAQRPSSKAGAAGAEQRLLGGARSGPVAPLVESIPRRR